MTKESVLQKLYPDRKFSFTPIEVMKAMDEYAAIWKQKAEDCRKALKWYKVQAELAKQTKDTDARLSIVTALELDGGARATKALEQWK